MMIIIIIIIKNNNNLILRKNKLYKIEKCAYVKITKVTAFSCRARSSVYSMTLDQHNY